MRETCISKGWLRFAHPVFRRNGYAMARDELGRVTDRGGQESRTEYEQRTKRRVEDDVVETIT